MPASASEPRPWPSGRRSPERRHPAGGAALIPSPAARLAASLEHVPDACREILAQIARAQAAGGGDVLVRLIVDAGGNVEVELPRRYSRRALEG
jgi:hypothetical protein